MSLICVFLVDELSVVKNVKTGRRGAPPPRGASESREDDDFDSTTISVERHFQNLESLEKK